MAVIDHAEAFSLAAYTPGASYADVPGMSIDMTALTDGDDYLFYAHWQGDSSDTNGNHLWVIFLDHNGVSLGAESEVEALTDGGTTYGRCQAFCTVVTASHSGTGTIRMQSKIDSGTGNFHNMHMSMINLTTMGSDATWSLQTGDNNANSNVYEGLNSSVTVGDGSSDYLIIGCIRHGDDGGGYLGQIGIEKDGTTVTKLSESYRGAAGQQEVQTVMMLAEAPAASTTYEVVGCAADTNPMKLLLCNTVAIRLNAFAQYEKSYTESPAAPTSASEYNVESLSFTANHTADWMFIGGINCEPATGADPGGNEIQADINDAGASAIAWDTTYTQRTTTVLNEGQIHKTLFTDSVPALTEGDSVAAYLRFLPPSSYADSGITYTMLVGFPLETKETTTIGLVRRIKPQQDDCPQAKTTVNVTATAVLN